MTEADILTKVTQEGWSVVEIKTVTQEGNLTVKGLLLVKPQDSYMLRQWVNYYVKPDGTCYWREVNPFPSPVTPTESFSQKVSAKINALVSTGTIKAGYIERINESGETALVVVVKNDGSLGAYHVYKSGEDLAITPVTGTYPI